MWKKRIKEYWVIPVSLIRLIPASFMGIFGTWILESVTGHTEAGYLISFMVWGLLSALPILIKIGKGGSLGRRQKTIYIILVGLLFSGAAFSLWNWVFGI